MVRINQTTAEYTASELFKCKLDDVINKKIELSYELYKYMLSVMKTEITNIHNNKELSNYVFRYTRKAFYIKGIKFDWSYYVKDKVDYLPATCGWENALLYTPEADKRNEGKKPTSWLLYNLDENKLLDFYKRMLPLSNKESSIKSDIEEAVTLILEFRTLTLLKKNWPEAYEILKATDDNVNNDPCKNGNTCDRAEKLRAKLQSKK